MRFFLIGLIILNTGVFAWQLLKEDQARPTVTAVNRGVEKLVLARELADQKEQEAIRKQLALDEIKKQKEADLLKAKREAEQRKLKERQVAEQKRQQALVAKSKRDAQIQASKPKGSVCYQMGQFKERSEANVALTGLDALDYKAKLVADYSAKSKFLVYLPGYSSLQGAQKATADLVSKGITDFQILAVYGKKNGISLGVFSQYDTANNRIREIKKLGYEPILQAISGKLEYHIDFNKRDKSTLSDGESSFLQKTLKNIKISQINCV